MVVRRAAASPATSSTPSSKRAAEESGVGKRGATEVAPLFSCAPASRTEASPFEWWGRCAACAALDVDFRLTLFGSSAGGQVSVGPGDGVSSAPMHHSPLMAQAATLRPSRARLQGTRGRTSSRLALGAWLLLSACGGAQKPSGEAPPAAETPTTSPASETRPELVPVDAPAGTFLWARLKNPAVLTDSLLAATGLPLDWRGLLESRVPELVAVSDLNAPVELAIVVNPNPRRQPLGVLSWGVGSEAAVLQQLDQMNVQAEEGPGGVHSFAIAEATCVVGPSLGSTPSRVVCGKEAQAVDVLGAYALRGLPRQELSG